MIAKKRVAAAAVWACAVAVVAGVTYQTRAEATALPGALECEDGDLVMSMVYEPDFSAPGATSAREALRTFEVHFPGENPAALEAAENAGDHGTFVRSEQGKTRFAAQVSEDGGWRLQSAAACVTPKGGKP